MILAFIIWSIVALIFLGIGISCRRGNEAAGFFTFTKPPVVDDIKSYNKDVSVLWFVSALVFEIMGVPFLFLEQNSPVFFLLIIALFIMIIAMMVTYIKIEGRHRK